MLRCVLFTRWLGWFDLMYFGYILVCCSCLFGGLLHIGWFGVVGCAVVCDCGFGDWLVCADCFFARYVLIVLVDGFFMVWFCFV